MTKILRATVIATLVLGLVATSATGAYAKGAQKEPLLSTFDATCATGALSGTPTDAFAVINSPRDKELSAEVSIKDGRPNTTYSVLLVQTPSGADCLVVDATLTTNGNGHGNAHISEPLRSDTTDAFVYIYYASFFDLRVTRDVVFR